MRRAARHVGVLLFAVSMARAQESATPSEAPEQKEETHKEFEAEFVASDIFRSGSYSQILWRGLGFEGDYFGGKTTDVGFTGAAWTFRARELKLSPGFGVVFGSNQFTTTPALSVRWEYEYHWFVTQGLVVKGFRDTPVFGEESVHGGPPEIVSTVRPTISDGDHVSVRWKRLTIGGTWEYIHFREGNEWKGGGRMAVRLFQHLSAMVYVLGPGHAEWRGGILLD